MSLCLNPQCSQPDNPDSVQFCQSCGSKLQFDGRYRAVRLLGQGGFGKTYEARDDRNTPKVLKVLFLDDDKAVSLFQQEAKVLAQLNYPGIPKADGYFTFTPRDATQPIHCIAMEKIEGESLAQWMQRRGNQPIDESLARQWLRELVEILHRVHQQHFFHRDIKPSNIMRRSDTAGDRLALIDFGTARQVTQTYIAKVQGGNPVTGIVSAGYTPPEQASGKAVPQSDFFALGRTFVYLLAGREPNQFPEDARTGQLQWRDAASGISAELADFLDELMAPFPGNRPQSTATILQRLDGGEATQSTTAMATVPATPQQSPTPTTTRVSETPAYVKWVIAATVLVLGGVGFAIYQSAQPPEPVTRTSPSPEPRESPEPSPSPTETEPSPEPTEEASPSPSPSPTPTPTPRPTREPVRIQPRLSPSNRVENFNLSETIAAHSDPVYSVAIAPSGNLMASGSANGTVKLWNPETGELVNTLSHHQSFVWSVAIAPNGETLASASADNRVVLWNASNGRRLHVLAGHRDQVRAVAFSPDSQTVASGAGGVYDNEYADYTVKVWDVATGEERQTLTGHRDRVQAIAFSPQGDVLASGGSDRTIRIWNRDSGEEVRSLSTDGSYISDIGFSPDGETLVSGGSDGVRVWNWRAGELRQTLARGEGQINAIALSSDGGALVSGGESGRVALWDLSTGSLKRVLQAEGTSVRSLSWSGNDRRIVVGQENGEVKVLSAR